jgi:hypothetical protein
MHIAIATHHIARLYLLGADPCIGNPEATAPIEMLCKLHKSIMGTL